jgi:hypothetical protein
LKDGTTQPPTLESLKFHTTQAQRLQTIQLEEKVVDLERESTLLKMEIRVLNGWVNNVMVYGTIHNQHVKKLHDRLQELDPGCDLLKYQLPVMPEKDYSLHAGTSRNADENAARCDLKESQGSEPSKFDPKDDTIELWAVVESTSYICNSG